MKNLKLPGVFLVFILICSCGSNKSNKEMAAVRLSESSLDKQSTDKIEIPDERKTNLCCSGNSMYS